jgi:hypothetical protein
VPTASGVIMSPATGIGTAIAIAIATEKAATVRRNARLSP